MEAKIGIIILFVLALLLAFILLLSGCTAADQGAQGGPSAQGQTGAAPQAGAAAAPQTGQAPGGMPSYGRGGNRSGMAHNLTDAQRQQMFAARMQMMATACQNKSEGGECSIQLSMGRMITGECKMQNGTLVCITGNGSYGQGFNQSPPNSG